VRGRYSTGVNIEVSLMSITSIRIADDENKPLEALSKKLDRSKDYILTYEGIVYTGVYR
jgi:hypothetical protein